MYPVDVQNPMYYRSHPYKNQFDLPTSAFKNRQQQQFYSQIPQGRDYFEQTNKKHFSNMFNRSEIQQDKVLKEDYPLLEIQKSRIAMDKSYFRSLNVNDIEGAKPNTLISKAVKNREKALTIMKKQDQPEINRSKVYYSIPSREVKLINIESVNHKSYHLAKRDQKIDRQQEAMNKFSKNKSIMENNSLRVLNSHNSYPMHGDNFGSHHLEAQHNSSSSTEAKRNYHFRSSDQGYTSPINNQFQKATFQSELMQKEQRIKQLQRQLSLQKQQSDHSSPHHVPKMPEISNPYVLQYPSAHPEHAGRFYNQKIHNFPQSGYDGRQRHQNEALKNNINHEKLHLNQNYKSNPGQDFSFINRTAKTPTSMLPSTHIQQSITGDNHLTFQNPLLPTAQNRQKSFTQKTPNLYSDFDKKNIRKYNPTFLSFQSDRFQSERNKGTIGIAAQNILH